MFQLGQHVIVLPNKKSGRPVAPRRYMCVLR